MLLSVSCVLSTFILTILHLYNIIIMIRGRTTIITIIVVVVVVIIILLI